MLYFFPPETSMIGTSNALGDYTLPSSFLHHRSDLAWTECFDKSDPMRKDSPALLERPRLQQMAETQSSKILPDRLGIFPLRKCTRDLEIQQQRNAGVSRTSENWAMGTTQEWGTRLAVFDAVVVWVGSHGRVFLLKWERLSTHWDKCVSTRPQAWSSTSHYPKYLAVLPNLIANHWLAN